MGFVIAPRIRAQSPPTTVAASPSFEVASIKPNRSGDMRMGIMFQPGRFKATGATVKRLISIAYNVRDFQVSGGPSWINSDKYDIDAKEPEGSPKNWRNFPSDQRREKMRLMIQSLLADRFKLKVSHQTKELPRLCAGGGEERPQTSGGKTGRHLPQRNQRP